ncbi:TRAP transporter small permease [Rhodobacteraceae bacterium NNCM2]|nr:TRAP transporter small permease [Coraliihabitans acroporae]
MRPFADKFYRAAAAVSLLCAWLAALIMAGMTLHILTEIVLRSFFDGSTHLVEEYVGYGLMTMVFLGLGHSLESGSLIRVDLVLDRLGARSRRGVELVICTAALVVAGFIGRYIWISMARKFAAGTVSMTTAATPMWIPEAVVLIGLAVFGLQLLAYALRLLAGGEILDEKASFE